MDARAYADRLILQTLLTQHPEWTLQAYADFVHRSVSWVKTWRQRLRLALNPTDPAVVVDRSRARQTPPPAVDDRVVDRILEIRDQPPSHLGRIPGPKTIAYFLHQDGPLRAAGCHIPAPSTIWRILRQHQRILAAPICRHAPLPRPQPLTDWQLDFKDPNLPPTDPTGKQGHVVEVLNTVDTGTSLWVDYQARPDFTMATVIEAVAHLVQRQGVPIHVNVDRDPRFVGKQHPRDTPSPFLRFWIALGVEITLSPPRHPETNGFVERFHRTLGEECLRPTRPHDMETLSQALAAFYQHYNEERPHQGLSCHNQPPRQAFPNLPPLPPIPPLVDPDRWVTILADHHYTRKVQPGGLIHFDTRVYYIGTAWKGQEVDLRLDPHTAELVASVKQHEIKRCPIKGLVGRRLPFEQFVAHLVAEAQRDDRRPTRHQARMW